MKTMKRLCGILIVLIICGLVFIFSSQKHLDNEYDISKIIGEHNTGGDISIEEYVVLVKNTIGTYLNYLTNEDFEKAYALLTPEYKEYVSYEQYLEEMQKLSLNGYRVKDMVRKTENMYEAYIEIADGNTYGYLIIFNDEKFGIAPDEFLKYSVVDEKIEKDKVEYSLIGYKVELNKCIFDICINNKNDEIIEISDAKMTTNEGGKVKADTAVFKVEPNTEVNVQIEFSTSIDFPATFEIERDAGKTIRTYIFKLR